ncbi:MAG: DeoR/GlpR family DNA-binding transcription regulator [Eubacteriales bacterium]|nr:DeoR/GlpR family DNA-binding transcription regulator [Eubacteriales bacterium]
MLQGERHLRILEMLRQSRTISVKQLCDSLEASEATIRRDLGTLELEGKLERTHGGAILTGPTRLNVEDSYNQKESMFEAQKRAIAKKAFERLSNHDSIILDAGTTTLELARLIGQSNLQLTVITNSTTVSSVISQNTNVELIAIGGKVRLNVLASVGHLAVEMLRRFNVNKTFVAANGISIESGLTTPDLDEAEVKRAMLECANERIVLADHSKFNRDALCQIAPLSMVDVIITDADIDESILGLYAQNDIEVIPT